MSDESAVTFQKGGEDLEATAKKAVNQSPDTIARLKKILAE